MDLLKNIFKGDRVIWIIFILLCLISVTEVFSATSSLAYNSGNHWGPITRHCFFLILGTIIVVFIHYIPYKWFQIFPVLLLPSSFVMLVMVMFMGRINGAARWLNIAGIQFQPSEFAKMAVVIAVAYILSRGQSEEGAHPKAFKYILIITGIFCGLIFPENYSTAMLLFATIYMMMFVGRIATKKLITLASTLIVMLGLFLTFLLNTPDEILREIPLGHRFSAWKGRIENFTKNSNVPAARYDIRGEDGQTGHASIAIAQSHLLGKGPGNSIQRDFLSQAYSDFIYAIIIEELGLLGGAFVTFLYIWLLIRVGKIARKCNRTFPAFLVLGIGILLAIQAMFNMMVAVGLVPVTGQPLPLISRGGTSTIINCVYIGILLSVSRYTQQLEEQQAHDAMIPMTVETATGDAELPLPTIEIQTEVAAEPTAKSMNSDEELV